jgi:uncharacterized protein (TIGR02145 family)
VYSAINFSPTKTTPEKYSEPETATSLTGVLDDIRIYNRLLNEKEIVALSEPKGKKQAGQNQTATKKPVVKETPKPPPVSVPAKVVMNADGKGSLTDPRDGKVYDLTTIGTQVWMAGNLAYRTGEGCYFYNNKPGFIGQLGYLYTYEAAKTACPSGWHLPSLDELAVFASVVGEAKHLKYPDYEIWYESWAGTNSNKYGFNAKAGGCYCFLDQQFYFYRLAGIWWSSSEMDNSNAYVMFLGASSGYESWIQAGGDSPFYLKGYGLSVRCVKDY